MHLFLMRLTGNVRSDMTMNVLDQIMTLKMPQVPYLLAYNLINIYIDYEEICHKQCLIICDYIQKVHNIEILHMIAEFSLDDDGVLWLINAYDIGKPSLKVFNDLNIVTHVNKTNINGLDREADSTKQESKEDKKEEKSESKPVMPLDSYLKSMHSSLFVSNFNHI